MESSTEPNIPLRSFTESQILSTNRRFKGGGKARLLVYVEEYIFGHSNFARGHYMASREWTKH
jgi:hypothetical protein